MSVTVRPLERSEWRMLRDLRLFALQTEPGVFASSYARQATLALTNAVPTTWPDGTVKDEVHYELPFVAPETTAS